MLCCPLTNQAKGYPFEVPAVPAAGSKVAGVILADQVRALDWRQRNAVKFAALTPQCMLEVSNKIKTLLP
jgi:mRNA interferase MazF